MYLNKDIFMKDQSLYKVSKPTFLEMEKASQEITKKVMLLSKSQYSSGTEGLGSAIVKIVTGIVNTFGHIVTTFKTNIFNFYKDLKRGELEYYHNSNMMSIRRILAIDYYKIQDIDVVYPESMSTTYLEATNNVIDFIGYLDMYAKVKNIKYQIEVSISKLFNDTESIDKINTNFDYPLVDMARQFKKVSDCFKGPKAIKGNTVKRFSVLFKKEKDLAEVNSKLLSASQFYDTVGKVYSEIQEIEKLFDELLKAIETDKVKNISKNTLMTFSGFASAIARMSDMYGNAMQDLQRLEHNYVHVLKTIRKKIEA